TRIDTGAGYASRTSLPTYLAIPVAGFIDPGNVAYSLKGFFPGSLMTRSAFNNGSVFNERGAGLTPPVPMRVPGWYSAGQLLNGDVNIVLADTGGTALLTFSGDKDWGTAYVTGSGYSNCMRGYFGSTTDLVAGTTYYLTLQPSSGTNCN